MVELTEKIFKTKVLRWLESAILTLACLVGGQRFSTGWHCPHASLASWLASLQNKEQKLIHIIAAGLFWMEEYIVI